MRAHGGARSKVCVGKIPSSEGWRVATGWVRSMLIASPDRSIQLFACGGDLPTPPCGHPSEEGIFWGFNDLLHDRFRLDFH
jgi:hypothetical protein